MTTWVKVLNSMPSHPKFLAAGDRASWLFVCGLCYSNEHLTDGFIARHALPVVAPGTKAPEQLAGKLVDAGLWHDVDGGWRIHDYGDVQRSAGDIRERRAKDSARKAADRSNGTPRGQIADSPADSAGNPSGVRIISHAGDRARSQEVEGREQKAESRPSEEVVGLCRRLARHVHRNDPKANPQPSSARWLTDMRLLVADRQGDIAEVERVIDWCQSDSFWRSNILSPGKLRKQFTQLVLRGDRAGDVVPFRSSNVSDLIRKLEENEAAS